MHRESVLLKAKNGAVSRAKKWFSWKRNWSFIFRACHRRGPQAHIHHICACHDPKYLGSQSDASHTDFRGWIPTFSLSTRSVTTSGTNRVWQLSTHHSDRQMKKRKKHSRAWHTELGAKHQQALSLCRGPWALEWNGQRGFLLCDEWRWRCCLWSGCLAGYWGAAAKVEDHRSARPHDFTAEAGLSSRMLVANAELRRAGLKWHFKPVNVAECGHRNARACVCLGNSCLFLSQRLLFSHHSNTGWQQDSRVVPYWHGAHTQAEEHEWHISNNIWKDKDKV